MVAVTNDTSDLNDDTDAYHTSSPTTTTGSASRSVTTSRSHDEHVGQRGDRHQNGRHLRRQTAALHQHIPEVFDDALAMTPINDYDDIRHVMMCCFCDKARD